MERKTDQSNKVPKRLLRGLGAPFVKMAATLSERRDERQQARQSLYELQKMNRMMSVISESAPLSQIAMRIILAEQAIPNEHGSHGNGYDIFASKKDGFPTSHQWHVILHHGPTDNETIGTLLGKPLGNLFTRDNMRLLNGLDLRVNQLAITCTSDYSDDGDLGPARTRLHVSGNDQTQDRSFQIDINKSGIIENYHLTNADGSRASIGDNKLYSNIYEFMVGACSATTDTAALYRQATTL